MFKPTYLMVYKYAFVVALILAESLFMFKLPKKPWFALRFALSVVVYFVFTAHFPQLRYDAVYSSLMFGSLFVFSIFLAKFCYDTHWKDCIFFAVAGYSMQHIASIMYNLVATLGGFDQSVQFYSNATAQLNPLIVAIFVQVYALTYWCLYQCFGKKVRKNENISIKSPMLLGLLVLMLLVEIVLNAFVVYRQYENLDLTYLVSASLTNMLCSLAVLIILFELLLRKTLEDELEIVNQMWRQERKQFDISKETIEMINIKCHDMRHQIHALRKGEEIRPEALKEIEQSIQIYDSIVETGNQALNIILAEKSLYCQKNDIIINCIIDGERLSFMSDIDVYSLFGNLIDNAIHSVMSLERDQRVISLAVKAKGQLLSINSHNYYGGKLRMKNGIPLTQSADTQHHGFGIKSMMLIAQKYEGTISFDAKDQIFNLNILFPLQHTPKTTLSGEGVHYEAS